VSKVEVVVWGWVGVGAEKCWVCGSYFYSLIESRSDVSMDRWRFGDHGIYLPYEYCSPFYNGGNV